MPPRETVGPWRPRREALERLGAPVAQALTEDLREARLELARAAACLAFALAWVGVTLAMVALARVLHARRRRRRAAEA